MQTISFIRKGDKFLNWNGSTLIFDPNFEDIPRRGLSMRVDGLTVASITWSGHDDYIFLRSAFVNANYRERGIFALLFEIMVLFEGEKPVRGLWREGGPLEPIMKNWNERWENHAST
jgi:hypothetical protein